ncbi:glycosyltransferase family 4 protein [Prevotella koreensis]|uniref:glycosyltransferase family 4 protein n=1 Tax=Prevotella koreensis TaxID=2490854 RepID=UPI003FA09A8C
MKIAHVVWGMCTGGVETMLVNIINEHVKTEDVRLYIVNDFVDEDIVRCISHKCKIYRLDRKPGSRNPIGILKLNLWLMSYNPDIVHVHSHNVSRLIFANRNIVRTIHGIDNPTYEYPRMKALYAISNAVKEFTINQGFPYVIEVDNGIRVEDVMKKHGQKPQDGIYKLVQLGRMYTPHKGQDLLVRALAILLRKGVKNFKMHFIGDGPSMEEVKELSDSMGLKDYIVFEGSKTQEEVYQQLCEYDVFVQPSKSEGFGLTVAEAVAAKLPVLVSNLPGPMEVIGNGLLGMSFETENVEDLAAKLEIILKGGYDYSLVDKAYKRAVELYDVRVTAKKYIDEYKKII